MLLPPDDGSISRLNDSEINSIKLFSGSEEIPYYEYMNTFKSSEFVDFEKNVVHRAIVPNREITNIIIS